MASKPEKPVAKKPAPRRGRQQSKKTTATPVNFGFDDSKPFKRCGHCGDVKPQCRAEKRCVKGLL
tara:strand:+ start:119 stop:313 length:195 start_codon:yes stop_codon:yes gene_type:complete